ncbi:MAG: hypothetical protein JOZ18_19140 [Chloroflexi bacterium]|nr:hypothetical protein [Chloroflexota bacterium]
MAIPLSLTNLVDVLRRRKKQSDTPYNLLLASTISLTPDVIRRICASDSWARFRTHLHRIGAEPGDLVDLLTEHVGIHNNLEGYQALAHLLKEGYFSTVLTTNIDSTLEDTLLEIGLQAPAFQVLIVGHDPDEDVANALDGRATGMRIIKLHGSLRERVLHERFPDFFEHSPVLREGLEHYLGENIVVVGSIKHDEDIIRTVNARKKSRVYYATPRKSSHDYIIKLIEARRDNLRTSVISGTYSEFTTFFQTLASMLLPDTSSPHISQSVVPTSTDVDRISLNSESHITDILLVTATEIEARAVLDCCPGSGSFIIDKKTYYDLGVIGDAKTCMVQSEMGSDGLGGSRFTVQEGIRALSPSAVIMVGIAFGVDAEKQHIGDILVSRQLVPYDPQRVSSDANGKPTIYMRGDRVSAPLRLLDRFKVGLKTWQEPPYVQLGLILSGMKLIDNLNYRDQLRQSEPEAIGGEMEGVGLYEAAQHYNVDWILVKGICDWADGNKHQDKDIRQKEAATNAIRFTLHVLQQRGFHDFGSSR